MRPVQRFHWESAEYAEAFATLVRCGGGASFGAPAPSRARFRLSGRVACGRLGGWRRDLTSLLLEHFQQVYAVEPHPGTRAVLTTRCPMARILDGAIMSTVPPTMEVGLISHVFYHVSDHQWGAYTIHAANQLTENGILIVTLNEGILAVIRCSSILGRRAMISLAA